MGKKILTGTTKLADVPRESSGGGDRTPALVRKRHQFKLKNFRLAMADIQRLQQLTDAINGTSERPISETAVVKGLILLGEKTPLEKLLKMIREVK